MNPNIPEGLFPVSILVPQTTNGGPITGDYISLKNVEMCWIVVHFQNATAATDATSILQDTAVGAGTAIAIVKEVPIWYGVVTTASTKLARQTDAVSYTTTDVTGCKIMIFQIDPSALSAGYDCVTIQIADSGHATNYVSAVAWIKPRYQSRVAQKSATEYIVD